MCSFSCSYKIFMEQELKLPNHNRRVVFCQWLLHFSHRTPKVLYQVYFSDKAWFHLSGYINAQNFRIWSSENPHEYRVIYHCICKRSVYSEPWADFRLSAMATAECYHEFIFSSVTQINKSEQYCYFQQNRACVHSA